MTPDPAAKVMSRSKRDELRDSCEVEWTGIDIRRRDVVSLLDTCDALESAHAETKRELESTARLLAVAVAALKAHWMEHYVPAEPDNDAHIERSKLTFCRHWYLTLEDFNELLRIGESDDTP